MQIEPPKAEPPKRKRRWFQFSLRTLMIGVTLLAIPCGWIGREAMIARERKGLLSPILNRGGGYIVVDSVGMCSPLYSDIGVVPRGTNGIGFAQPVVILSTHLGIPKEPSLIRSCLGDVSVADIWLPANMPSEDAARIKVEFRDATICQGVKNGKTRP